MILQKHKVLVLRIRNTNMIRFEHYQYNFHKNKIQSIYERSIPVHTIKGWESSATSSRHRECSPYICKLLERVVNENYRRSCK